MAWRHAQLDGLLRLLKEEAPRFEAALAADLGRSPLEAFAADIGATATEIAHLRKHVGTWAKPRKVRLPLNARPGSGHIVPEPLGVTLVVAPWNYPVQLVLLPIAAAISAGNAVVAKPSELAPATSALLAGSETSLGHLTRPAHTGAALTRPTLTRPELTRPALTQHPHTKKPERTQPEENKTKAT